MYLNSLAKFLFVALFIFSACSKESGTENKLKHLTIFFVNDVHGQLDNFSKVKHIIDKEKLETEVIVACSGDIFSGNPVVDNYTDKGFPVIDVMNRVGFDIMALGNHEFDYGIEILNNRISQAEFEIICANVNTGNTLLEQTDAFKTIVKDDIRVTFLGLVETNGKKGTTIPSSHPWKMEGLTFEKPESVIDNYSGAGINENADLFILLSHLGFQGNSEITGDEQIAEGYPWIDLIIGGHSYQQVITEINNIPIVQAGSYLHSLGKIQVSVKNKKILSYNAELINLDNYTDFDPELQSVIDDFNELPYLNDVIGYSGGNHSKQEVGCFYTDALREAMHVDATFQNTGGIRAELNEGEITKREIFEISPFNNGTVIYEMTVEEIGNFLIASKSGFYFSGIGIRQEGGEIEIRDKNGNVIPGQFALKVGLNDYIPAVYDFCFPMEAKRQLLNDAETLILYLKNLEKDINYTGCNRYFRYN